MREKYSHILCFHINNTVNFGWEIMKTPLGQQWVGRIGAQNKRNGVMAGIPDLQIPIAKIDDGKLIPALWLELKTTKGNLSDDQKRVKSILEASGHRVVVPRSVEDGMAEIKLFLNLKDAVTEKKEESKKEPRKELKYIPKPRRILKRVREEVIEIE